MVRSALAATLMNRPDSINSITSDLAGHLQASGLKPLRLGGQTLLPIVQGGMGVVRAGEHLAQNQGTFSGATRCGS